MNWRFILAIIKAMKPNIKSIPEFLGYFVSDEGDVYSTWRQARIKGRRGVLAINDAPLHKLQPVIDEKGRHTVGLSKNGKKKHFKIHVLVLTAFVGPRPKGQEACHFPDSNLANNHLSNLRWDSKGSNYSDRVVHGTANDGEKNGSAKLVASQVLEIVQRRRDGETYQSIADRFGVALMTVQMICTGVTWSQVTRIKRKE